MASSYAVAHLCIGIVREYYSRTKFDVQMYQEELFTGNRKSIRKENRTEN